MERRIIEFRVWNCACKIMIYPDWKELASRATLSEMILMEHFGKYDKKGNKIFEGDIIKCGKGKCSIGFIDGEFSFCNQKDWLDEWNWADDSRRFEIIGNIYENPELIDIFNNL